MQDVERSGKHDIEDDRDQAAKDRHNQEAPERRVRKRTRRARAPNDSIVTDIIASK